MVKRASRSINKDQITFKPSFRDFESRFIKLVGRLGCVYSLCSVVANGTCAVGVSGKKQLFI
jgi:hypothetical protein